MKLVTYRRQDGYESVGVFNEELNGPYDLIRAIEIYATAGNYCIPLAVDMLDMLDTGMFEGNLLREVDDFVYSHKLLEELSDADDYELLAPIARPRTIYAIGRNYPAHARESGLEVADEPTVFLKASTAVIGPEKDVVYKKWLTRVDPEAELAVIIGKEGSNISEESASEYIAGYTILNDVTARDIQKKDLDNAQPWFRSKGIDTFCPMGPWIVLNDEITHPIELDVEMRVNGEIRQQDNTRSLAFSVPFLISWISRYVTLYPGDVISTGTPEGMKPVVPGDVMEAYVEGIGVLKSTVVAEE